MKYCYKSNETCAGLINENYKILPKLTYRFNIIMTKVSARISVDTHKIILIFIWKGKGPRITEVIMGKNKGRSTILPDFRAFHGDPACVTLVQGGRVDRGSR